MDFTAAGPTRYDTRSIVLHWLTAAFVGALWLLGQTIDVFPRGMPRTSARSLHIVLGVALAVLLVARIRHRRGSGVRLAPAGRGALDQLAGHTHTLLYLLLIGAVLLGIANAWV